MNAFTKIHEVDHAALGDSKHDRMLELVLELRESEKIEATDDWPDPTSPVMEKVIGERPAVASRDGAVAVVEHLLTDMDEFLHMIDDDEDSYENMHRIMLCALRDYLAGGRT